MSQPGKCKDLILGTLLYNKFDLQAMPKLKHVHMLGLILKTSGSYQEFNTYETFETPEHGYLKI